MVTPDDIKQLAQQLQVEQYNLGHADGDAAATADATAKIEALDAMILDLQHQLATFKTPAGYTEVDAKNLQAALDAGTPSYVRGEFDYTSLIKIPPPGAKIWLADEAALWRKFNSNGATQSPLIGNRDWTKPTGPVSIRGTGHIQAREGFGGNLISTWCSTLELLDFQTEYWIGGRLFMLGVDGHLEIGRVKFNTPSSEGSGTGGIRVSHCGSGLIHDIFDSSSGDDFAQGVPAGNTGDPLFNRGDINNLTYTNLRRNRSYFGRLCVCGLQDQYDDGKLHGMKSGVYNTRFEHFDGFSGKSAFVHQNKSSLGRISGTTTDDVVISRKYATLGQPDEIFMNGVAGTGGVDNVDLSGVTIIDDRINPLPDGTKNPNKPIYGAQGKVTNVIKPPQAA